MSFVAVDNLSKHFVLRRRQVRALDGVSFSIPQGHTLGVVGESGSGKTTLARALLRLVEPTSGRVQIAGTDVTSLGAAELRRFRRHMQIVFQDPDASLNPRMRVGDIVGEPLVIHDLPNREQRVRDLLGRVGLRPDAARRFPREFSGGQRQRIGIARALAAEPEVIVLDEPVSALDVSIGAQIVNLLLDLQREQKLTYVFISHDIRVVAHMSDEIAVMQAGKIVEHGPTSQVMSDPQHPYTQSLLSASRVSWA